MGAGVWLHVTERHAHEHAHEILEHDHLHRHDATFTPTRPCGTRIHTIPIFTTGTAIDAFWPAAVVPAVQDG
jgi:hypothetical protein